MHEHYSFTLGDANAETYEDNPSTPSAVTDVAFPTVQTILLATEQYYVDG